MTWVGTCMVSNPEPANKETEINCVRDRDEQDGWGKTLSLSARNAGLQGHIAGRELC